MNQQNQIPLTSFTDFVCDAPAKGGVDFTQLLNKGLPECNGREFVPVIRVKTYKGLLSGGQKIIAQVQVFKCCACGAVHDLNAKP